jgi:GR25 family glycosyltransferase involved in LPS biosynthesis
MKENNEKDNKNKNYLDGIDIIYWINLDRAKDRKQHMEDIFKDDFFNNVKKERITALDGKKENPINKFIIKQDMNLLNDNKNRIDTEYACLYSHLKAIKTFSKTNYDIALIVEDDLSVEYKKYWKKTIQEVMNNAPKDWEILKLDICELVKKTYTLWEPILLKNNKDYYKYEKIKWKNFYLTGNWGATSYLIKNSAAKKLMKNMLYNNKFKLNNNYMHVADAYLYQMLKTYIYKYPFFTVITNHLSYIQNKITDKTPYFKKNIKKYIYNKTKKNKTKKNKTKKNKTKKNKTKKINIKN